MFFEKGDPLPEEEPRRYLDRRVSRRLSREYVLALSRALGFPVDDDRYWTSDEPAAYFVQPLPPRILPDVTERRTC
jgi:hypothetical protein